MSTEWNLEFSQVGNERVRFALESGNRVVLSGVIAKPGHAVAIAVGRPVDAAGWDQNPIAAIIKRAKVDHPQVVSVANAGADFYVSYVGNHN